MPQQGPRTGEGDGPCCPWPGPEGMRPDTRGTVGAPLPDLVPFPHTSFLIMVGLADEQAQAVWAPLRGWHLARGMT